LGFWAEDMFWGLLFIDSQALISTLMLAAWQAFSSCYKGLEWLTSN
jgi:hypothetical protein